jgi:hypothetical protein
LLCTSPKADLAHDSDLGAGVGEHAVVALTEAHGSFEQSSPGAAQHVAEGQQLVGSGPGAGDGTTVGDDVAQRAAGRDPEGAGPQRLLGHLAHQGDVLSRARAFHHRAFAHSRDP